MSIHDVTSGYRLYKRAALEQLHFDEIRSTGYRSIGCTARAAPVAESPIVFYERTLGESKLGTREIYVGALRMILLRLSSGKLGAKLDSSHSQSHSRVASNDQRAT
jgi:hypothetical protein